MLISCLKCGCTVRFSSAPDQSALVLCGLCGLPALAAHEASAAPFPLYSSLPIPLPASSLNLPHSAKFRRSLCQCKNHLTRSSPPPADSWTIIRISDLRVPVLADLQDPAFRDRLVRKVSLGGSRAGGRAAMQVRGRPHSVCGAFALRQHRGVLTWPRRTAMPLRPPLALPYACRTPPYAGATGVPPVCVRHPGGAVGGAAGGADEGRRTSDR